MRTNVVIAVVALWLGSAVVPAFGQVTSAEGQAFGARLDLLGANLIDASNTGVGTAPNASSSPNSFNLSAASTVIPLPPVANVITNPSRTRGCSSPGTADCDALFTPAGGSPPLPVTLQSSIFSASNAGDAVAQVLPGAAPGGVSLLEAVTSNANSLVECSPTAGLQTSTDSKVDLLVIAGNAIPLNQSPNTTVIVPGLPLVVLNETTCSATNTVATCTVNALHAQLIDPLVAGVLDLKLSSASSTIRDFPANCSCAAPILTNSRKTAVVLNPNGTVKAQQVPAAGDKIRYTVSAVNSSSCSTGTNLTIIDRIPRGTTFDAGSTQIQVGTGTPTAIAGTLANCSASLQFTGCTGEAPSDTSRQCLTVVDGDLPPNSTKSVIFTVTVNSGSGCSASGGDPICNTALIVTDQNASTPEPRSITIQCPPGPGTPTPTRTPTRTPTGGGGGATPTPGGGGGGTATPTGVPPGTATPQDVLVTTGSGCSLGPNRNVEAWPALLLGALMVMRRRRSRGSRP